jgi:hypothetical protein
MKKILSLLLAATLASAALADQAPLFNATLTIGKEHRFVLMSEAGKTSSFLRLGETFDGYKLKDYDTKTGELTLEKDGKATKLTLMADASNSGVAATSTPATITDATAVLNAMNFREMMDKTMAGVKKQQSKMVDGMMAQMMGPGMKPEDKEAVVAFQKRVIDEMMSAVTGADMQADVAKAYSEVFSKEQLGELANFYSSPLGKTFADKQPELAEKMNAAMMPRMMSVMPKVQQMSRDFAQEMKAKKAAAADGAGASAPKP